MTDYLDNALVKEIPIREDVIDTILDILEEASQYYEDDRMSDIVTYLQEVSDAY